MRKIISIFSSLVLGATSANAQTVATFESLSLPASDTFYVDYSNPGNDVGFDDGLAHYACVYDTAFGFKSLVEGFVYSNKTDTLDATYNNPNSARTGKGYGNSSQYVVGFAYNGPISVTLNGKAKGQPVKGFYITNTTFAYETMKKGDGFTKKFGGTPNIQPDWFRLTIKGYLAGAPKPDSVNFYLADFRPLDSTKDYIVKDWTWVDMAPLGNVDSITFALNSTDTIGGFGMNNPAYFCMDNFETYETSSVGNTPAGHVAKVYPNPATDLLYIELLDDHISDVFVTDLAGRLLARMEPNGKTIALDTKNYIPGTYLLQLQGTNGTAFAKFVKQ